eukprot:scaffold20725_cov111-Isochrysis_galbana.AAC.12
MSISKQMRVALSVAAAWRSEPGALLLSHGISSSMPSDCQKVRKTTALMRPNLSSGRMGASSTRTARKNMTRQ